MKLRFVILFVLLVVVANACKKSNKCTQRNLQSGDLTGTWQSRQEGDIVFAATVYHLRFDGTSFFIKEQHFSDIADTSTVTCPTYNYSEYEEGAYLLRGDTIFLDGSYADSTYHAIDTGCFNTGAYHNLYIAKIGCDSIYLSPLSPYYKDPLVFYRHN
jgi:hypothetical protein